MSVLSCLRELVVNLDKIASLDIHFFITRIDLEYLKKAFIEWLLEWVK